MAANSKDANMLAVRGLLLLVMTCVSGVGYSQSNCVKDRYGEMRCGPAGSRCLMDYVGEIRCSPRNGGIALDRYRIAECGPGRCMIDRDGDVFCSSAKGTVKGSAEACIGPMQKK